jgi:hypothetical protein
MQQLPTRAAIFFDLTNQFNSVSREDYFNVISTSFPELLPLSTLFYEHAGTVHHKWDDGSWRTLLMKEGVSQGCLLSPLFASFVVARLLKPINKLLRQCASDRLASGDPGDDGFSGYHTSLDMWMTTPLAFTFTTSHSSATLSSLSVLPLAAL